MQPRIQNFIARERREMLYLFGKDSNWHCNLSASRRERNEKGEGRDEKRRDGRLAEYAIFTVSDGFLLRQSTDTLLVNVELLF